MKSVYTTILLLCLSGCATLTHLTALQLAGQTLSDAHTGDDCMQIGDNNTCDKTPHVQKPHCPNGVDETGKCIFLICQYDSDQVRHCSQSVDEHGNPGPEYVPK